MTALGLQRTWEACRILFRARALRQPIYDMVCALVPTGSFRERFAQVWGNINQLARWFGDTSTTEMYDHQTEFTVPPFTPLEEHLNRCYGPDAGCRVPDFVLHFLALRGAIEPAVYTRGSRSWRHRPAD